MCIIKPATIEPHKPSCSINWKAWKKNKQRRVRQSVIHHISKIYKDKDISKDFFLIITYLSVFNDHASDFEAFLISVTDKTITSITGQNVSLSHNTASEQWDWHRRPVTEHDILTHIPMHIHKRESKNMCCRWKGRSGVETRPWKAERLTFSFTITTQATASLQ